MDNTTETVPPAQDVIMYYIRQFITLFVSYIMIIIIAFGVFTNLLSMFIFYRRRKKDKVSAQYLGPLAFVDFVNIASFSFPSWLYDNLESWTGLKFDRVVGVQSDLDCKIYLYFWLAFAATSSWIIVCFSIERVLVIWFPLRMQSVVASNRPRKMAVITVFTASLLAALVILHTSGMVNMEPDSPQRRQCAWSQDATDQERVLHLQMFLIFANGIPCISITILNICLLLGLKCSRMDAKSSADSQTRAESKILKNLMLISLFYIIFTSPNIVIWNIYLFADLNNFEGYSQEEVGDLGRLSYFSSSFIGMNYGCNAIVYVISLDYYRVDCKRLLTCGIYGKLKGSNKANSDNGNPNLN